MGGRETGIHDECIGSRPETATIGVKSFKNYVNPIIL